MFWERATAAEQCSPEWDMLPTTPEGQQGPRDFPILIARCDSGASPSSCVSAWCAQCLPARNSRFRFSTALEIFVSSPGSAGVVHIHGEEEHVSMSFGKRVLNKISIH